ncbi:MAG: hypothetical protein HYX92_12775 [Chloroflexi bacterium]|nr:hypothetical protein [Chloroflexota bacterium]
MQKLGFAITLALALTVIAGFQRSASADPEIGPQIPAPAPQVDPAPPQPVTRHSKMGVGVYSMGGGHLIHALKRIQPGVILLMDPDPAFARDVRKLFPNAFIVGRRYFREQPLDNPQLRGERAADHVAALAAPLKGVVNAWVSYNEPLMSGDYEAYKLYNTFQVAFARKLQGTYGIPAVAANDGIGSIWPADYVKYFADAVRESTYFGVHAYPDLKSVSMKEEAEWHVLRYRLIHLALSQQGIERPFIITESGLADGFPGYTTEHGFANDLAWFTNELDKDPYVVGHAIYGLFGAPWRDTADILPYPRLWDRIGQYQPKAPRFMVQEISPESQPGR